MLTLRPSFWKIWNKRLVILLLTVQNVLYLAYIHHTLYMYNISHNDWSLSTPFYWARNNILRCHSAVLLFGQHRIMPKDQNLSSPAWFDILSQYHQLPFMLSPFSSRYSMSIEGLLNSEVCMEQYVKLLNRLGRWPRVYIPRVCVIPEWIRISEEFWTTWFRSITWFQNKFNVW